MSDGAPAPEPRLSQDEQQRLQRAYDDLLQLASGCEVPAVRAAARAALALVAQALNGQGLGYNLYSSRLDAGTPPVAR